MDVFTKFIIETDEEHGDCLILAKCTYHKQLVTNKNNVKGGGWWSLDRESDTFTLHGNSYEFGRATIEDISNCIKNGKVFSSPSLVRNFVNDGFKFNYKTESGEIINL
jgi:hypothetical protein